MYDYHPIHPSTVVLQPFGSHGYTVTYRDFDADFMHSLKSFQQSLGPGWMSRVEIGAHPHEVHMHVFPRTDLMYSVFAQPPRYGAR